MPAARLISTVGTSLLGNLDRVDPSADPPLAEAHRARDAGRIASHLLARSPFERICGAEIGSIADLLRAGYLADPPRALHFCLSETAEGDRVGAILAAYYEGRACPARFHTISGLRDDDPERFAAEGLRNLVRTIASILREEPGARGDVAINATGGFKAQTAVSVLAGQALGLDVYYKHERFDHIIAFPPLPVRFDPALHERHRELFDRLQTEGEAAVAERELEPSLLPLLARSGSAWTLSPAGQLYLESIHLADYTVEDG